jgi:hypothetical protein
VGAPTAAQRKAAAITRKQQRASTRTADIVGLGLVVSRSDRHGTVQRRHRASSENVRGRSVRPLAYVVPSWASFVTHRWPMEVHASVSHEQDRELPFIETVELARVLAHREPRADPEAWPVAWACLA